MIEFVEAGGSRREAAEQFQVSAINPGNRWDTHGGYNCEWEYIPSVPAFEQRLHENGLIEGSNVEVEYFGIEGSPDRMRELAADARTRQFRYDADRKTRRVLYRGIEGLLHVARMASGFGGYFAVAADDRNRS